MWRAIPNFERYYVNELGQVKGKTGKILKPIKNDAGYLTVNLYSNNKKRYNKRIHRLVAEAFIPNDDSNRSQVNHINGDKTDNRVENLEWVNNSENMKHASENGLLHSRRKASEITFYCKELPSREFHSFVAVAKLIGCDASTVRRCCNGNYASVKGYHFSYTKFN